MKKTQQLGEILELQYGKSLPDRDRKPGDVPVYGSGGIVGTHEVALVKGPGVIVGRKGSVGSVFFEMRDFYPIDTVYYVCPRNSLIDIQYAYYLLANLPLATLNTDAAVPGLNRTRALSIEVRIPLITQQKELVSILSAYDDLIENNQRRITLLEESARLLYQEWFVRLRFPGYEHVRVVDGVPVGWEKIYLGDVCDTQYGYTETATKEPIGPKFLRGMDINKTNFIDWSTVPYCPIDEILQKKYQLHVGDIVIIRMADPGKVAIIESAINAVFASYLIRLRLTDPRLTSYYLFYVLSGDAYQGFVSGVSTGSTRKTASAPLLVDFHLLLPQQRLIRMFEDSVTPFRQQINTLLIQNQKLRTARDILLPKLMNGEIAV